VERLGLGRASSLSCREGVFSETQGSGDIEKSRGPSRLRSFHAFARLHLGRNVTEEESHADLLAGGDGAE